VVEEPVERKVNYSKVVVTEVTDNFTFYAQKVDNGPQPESMMDQMRQEMTSNPPTAGSYTPKRGETCAAKFSGDDQWYRAKITKVETGKAQCLFIDFGNKETVAATSLAALPSAFQSMPAQAHEYALAGITLPPDEDAKQDAVDALYNDALNRQMQLNVEYKANGVDYVTLLDDEEEGKGKDVGLALVTGGYVVVEQRKEKRLAKLMSDYKAAQEKAKKERANIWRYGDFMEDDAREFGFSR